MGWRVGLWLTLGVVGAVRWLFPPEPMVRPPAWVELETQGDRWGRRPATRVQEPMSPVPKDLWRLEIEIAPEDVEILRGYRWRGPRGGGGMERPQVRVTVREGGQEYRDVALHLKGAAGSFRSVDDKPAMTLNFNKHVRGQRFHGYGKFSLNNSVQDPTYLSEAISRELFEAAGVPAPTAGHATVVLNGRDLGLFVVAEGWGKPFLRRHFSDVGGNLYDGGFLEDVHPGLDTNSGDDESDRSDIERLLEAVHGSIAGNRWERLSGVLDVERFARFLAMEILTCHWDGYGQNRNNFRLFHDQSTGRMVFLPHGMDQMFGAGRSSPYSSIEAPMRGVVARAFMATVEGRRMVMERLATLRSEVLVEDRVVARVRELAARIRPTLAAYHPDWAREHDRAVEDLCVRIVERARSVTEQLASPRLPLEFGEDGMARLSGWRRQMTARDGAPLRFEVVEQDGVRVLRIATAGAGGTGSWRTRVNLEPGRYRFEGRARTEGGGREAGVCLRISGARAQWLGGSDGEWMPLQFRLEVEEALAEVELVCEFGGARGEGWFDEGSLRLIRER
ncbi:MAG: CotH kinase family protein [Verrucomicrobiae bacterium]|nr:CotH kinase family protein [Verrucomicrobiae bacterium]